MNKVLKFKQTEDCKVYFVSDLHHNHNPKWNVPLWKARGYSSVEEMNQDQIDTINRIVRPKDILWHLGDLTLNCSEKQLEEFISKLNCQNIYCLWGNHNSPTWNVYNRELENIWANSEVIWTNSASLPESSIVSEIYPLRYKNLVFFGNYQEVIVDGQYIVLEHFPVLVWNNMKDGVWHLCGHSHYGLPFSKADNLKAKILDVGWDGNLAPYSLDEIKAIMDKKEIFDAGDHHRNNI